MRPGVFGTWDAPATDGMETIPVPIGYRCVYCRENIAPGDSGAVGRAALVYHRECMLRSVAGGIGHQVEHEYWCAEMHDPDAGLGYRTSAILVYRTTVGSMAITPEELRQWGQAK